MMQQQALAGILSLAKHPILFSFVLETVTHSPYVCSWLLLQPLQVSRNLSMTPPSHFLEVEGTASLARLCLLG